MSTLKNSEWGNLDLAQKRKLIADTMRASIEETEKREGVRLKSLAVSNAKGEIISIEPREIEYVLEDYDEEQLDNIYEGVLETVKVLRTLHNPLITEFSFNERGADIEVDSRTLEFFDVPTPPPNLPEDPWQNTRPIWSS